MATEGLLECMFCGSKKVELHHAEKQYYVVCGNCNFTSPSFLDSLVAVNLWNQWRRKKKDGEQNDNT